MPVSSDRQRQVGEFFAAHADQLLRLVARHARDVPEATIEDACSIAWATLLRRHDVTLDARGFCWLTTVAIHAGWSLSARLRAESPYGIFNGASQDHDHTEIPELADVLASGTDEQAFDRVQRYENVKVFRTLKPREREALYLQALGYTYKEIVSLTGFTYTAVNRYITEGRRALRRGGYSRTERARHRHANHGRD